MSDGKTIRIQQYRSLIGCTEGQREAVKGLGLRRISAVVEREDTPSVRGNVNKVPHLVRILED